MSNVKPKKHLGQHFLTDQNIARKIVGLLPGEAAVPVVEIGPGTGVLTQYLLERKVPLTLVEFDEEAANYLQKEYGDQLTLHHADFLKWDIASELAAPAHFIGNLPYNISSPIFFRLLENLEKVKSGTFMVQKEVAERICADPGSKVYGILSVLLGYYFDLKYAFTVSEKVFRPRPKVKSAVFTMVKKTEAPAVRPEQLIPVVKAAFGQRRKTLRNALKSFALEEAQLPEGILDQRAEQLTLTQFEQIAIATLK